MCKEKNLKKNRRGNLRTIRPSVETENFDNDREKQRGPPLETEDI